MRYQSATELRTQIETAVTQLPPGQSSLLQGVGAFIEHSVLPVEESPFKRLVRKHWRLLTGVAVTIAVYMSTVLLVIPALKTHANVVMRNPAVEGSNFVFDYEVDCPPGWSVWTTLVESNGNVADVQRYQAPLKGTGHVRMPLHYLKKDTGTTLPPKEEQYRLAPRRGAGWTLYGNGLASPTPMVGGANVTLHMYPEGKTPTTEDGVPYKTVGAPRLLRAGPFLADYPQGKIELVRLTSHPSDGKTQWMPNGQPCTEQDLPKRGGHSLDFCTFTYSLPRGFPGVV